MDALVASCLRADARCAPVPGPCGSGMAHADCTVPGVLVVVNCGSSVILPGEAQACLAQCTRARCSSTTGVGRRAGLGIHSICAAGDGQSMAWGRRNRPGISMVPKWYNGASAPRPSHRFDASGDGVAIIATRVGCRFVCSGAPAIIELAERAIPTSRAFRCEAIGPLNGQTGLVLFIHHRIGKVGSWIAYGG